MNELIWVGNTLMPRGVVIAAAVIILLAVVGLVALTYSLSSKDNP